MNKKIEVDQMMLPMVNRIVAIADLFGAATKSGEPITLGYVTLIGLEEILDSAANEIINVSCEVNDMINAPETSEEEGKEV